MSFIPTPPPPEGSRAAHSVYFQLLGDVGFVGLGIFLLILFRAWRSCGKLIRRTAGIPELEWINSLCRAFQVSLIAYAVAGGALNMAYFEMLYVLVVLVGVQETLVRQYQQSQGAKVTPVAGEARPKPHGPPSRRPLPAPLIRRGP